MALIDADVIVYRTAFGCQKKNPETGELEVEEDWIACSRASETVEQILADTNATEFQLWLSDSTQNGFRVKYYPQYKAGRPPKPALYDVVKTYLINEWGAKITEGQEADDMLGILQQKHPNAYNNCDCIKSFNGPSQECSDCYSSVICSIDKDLFQVPGHHFNFVKKEHKKVSSTEGLWFFYFQLLKGDTSDNIQGCPGIGDAKAGGYLAELSSEEDLFNKVVEVYKKQFEKKLNITDEAFVLDSILMNGRCLKIRQYEGEIWELPNFEKKESPKE